MLSRFVGELSKEIIVSITKFNFKLMDGEILKRQESELKFISPFDYSKNRNTFIDYKLVTNEGNDYLVPVVKYHVFDNTKGMLHGFSTRLGGVSKEHLSSMNLSFSRGDDRENVMRNHDIFAQAVGYDAKRLVFSDQVHDIKIHTVTKADIGKGISRESDITAIDGLVTNEKNIPLITFFADCVPIFFYDNVKKVIGLCHSGWKGTVGKIGKEMVNKMVNEFGCNAKDIICAIGPSICVDCYEVSEDVIEQFKASFDEKYYSELFYGKGGGKYQLNLHMACKLTLLEAGVLEENIALPDLCTCCNPNVLFSHRASGGMRGNLSAVMMLLE